MERYSVIRGLGEGGAGRVRLVEDRLRPGTRLALKDLVDATPEHVAGLRREFATLAALRHPNLIEVHEFDADPATGAAQFTMEWVDGDDVVAAIRREGPASLPTLAAEALHALAFLHDFGIVHRDVKPANLLVRKAAKRGRRLVLLDFGLARERHVEAASAAMGGTLPYLAPEMFDGAPPSKRTDLYALGAVLYEAIHGRTPFVLKGNDTAAFLAALREGRRARPALPAGYPAGLARWIDDMIAADPAARPSSAADALARLNEACGTVAAPDAADDRAARLGSGAPAGRDDELARVRAELAPSAQPRVVWLAGDAGSGKSRLARHVAGEATRDGWTVHAPPGRLPDAIDAFVDRVRADATRGPTLVVLDELERADAEIVGFLERIAREPREAPVRVLAALRPAEVQDARLRKLVADTGVVPSLARIDLAPMSADALRAMIDRASAGRSSSQARVAWLLDASEGNAGAAEALLVEGIWEKRAKVPVARALEQSIRRRLDALSPEARGWLEALAVLGDDAPAELAAELSGLEHDAPAAEAEAIAAGLARRTGASVSPDSRRAAEAVRAATPPDRLRQLHALAATHYAAQERDVFGAVAWRLARLWRGAGETDRAVAAALDAASAAETKKDWSVAAERYAFALRSLGRKDPRRGELWWKRAEAARRGADHRTAAKSWGVAARRAQTPARRVDARAWQLWGMHFGGRSLLAERRAKELESSFGSEASPNVVARALTVRAAVRSHSYDPTEARRLALDAVDRLPSATTEDRVDALLVAMMADSRLDDSLGDSYFEECLRLCRALDLPQRELTVWLIRAQRMERALAATEHQVAVREAQRVLALQPTPEGRIWVAQQAGRARLNEGRYDLALRELIAGEEIALFAGRADVAAGLSSVVSEVLVISGRAAEAVTRESNWLKRENPRLPEAYRRGASGELAAALLASPAPPAEEVQQLISDFRGPDASVTPVVAFGAALLECDLALARGDSETIRLAVERLRGLVLEPRTRLVRSVRALAEVVLGRALVNLKDWSGVTDSADRLLALSSAEVLPAFAARAMHFSALALEARGQPEEAHAAGLEAQRLLTAAAERIGDHDLRLDFLSQAFVREIRAGVRARPDAARVEALYEMIRTLNSESDPEALLASILEMTMNAVEAERGMVLLAGPTGQDFSVRLARNLEKETEADAEAFSRRIVAEAGQGKSILALDAGHDDRFKDFKSVSLYRIRSLMCAPLKSRGKIIGTVYLDSRRNGRPFTDDDLRFVEAFADHAALALENARHRAQLESENKRLRAMVGERSSYGQILGRSPVMQRVFDMLERVAPSDVTVLIHGESGTGKELVARALHFNGPRAGRPFLSENCAALTESLLESELFGHVKGAFTGADRDRAGLFEQAHEGTLFLDEVGDMSPSMQARLLRVLQEGELRRVGGEHSIKVNVRVLSATNKDLQAEVAAGRFREDLYYRLAVVPISLPPLRERVGDVAFLVGQLLERLSAARNRPTPRIEPDVLDAFERYPWPGNVRQLDNLLRRVVLLAGDGVISRSVLESDPELARMFLGAQEAFVPVMSIARGEEDQIRRALEAANGHRDRAARLLGISRATIYRKMREYNLR